jgi:hypothetical protein
MPGRVDVLIRGADPAAASPQPLRITGRATFNAPSIVASLNRFPGDPGNKVLHGLNNTTNPTFNAVQTAVGRNFKLRRSYNGANWGFPTTAMTEDAAAGRIPVVSWKLAPYSLTSVPDSAIDTMISQAQAYAPKVIWASVFHEPEEDFPDDVSASQYRALYRRTVLRFRAAGVTNVAWYSPAFKDPFIFNTNDFRKWHPDWNGGNTNTAADWFTGTNAVCDLEGLDIYVPLINTSNWQAPSVQFNIAKTVMNGKGYTLKPVITPELGIRSQTAAPPVGIGASGDPNLGPSLLQDAFETATTNNWVGILWWNTGGDSFLHGPVPGSDPGGFREAKLASIVADPRSA